MSGIECMHEKFSPYEGKREFNGHEFKYQTSKCDECGSVAFDSRHSKAFYLWMKELREKDRELFRIQKFKLPESIWVFIENDFKKIFAERTGDDLNINYLLLASINLYIKKVSTDTDLSQRIEKKFLESNAKFISCPLGDKKLEIPPRLYVEYFNWAEKFGLSVREFTERAAARLLFAVKFKIDTVDQDLINKLSDAA